MRGTISIQAFAPRYLLFGAGFFCSALCLTLVEVNVQVGTPATDSVPEPRLGHGLVYHEGLHRVLLFGGRDAQGVPRADLWAWDGRTWTLLDDGTSEAPAPRSRFAMAYDRKRDRIVVQGGGTREQEYGDTWEWDSEHWVQVDQEGPGPRSHHAMAYDAARGQVVLFGGSFEGAYQDDLWEWDGAEWTLVED